MAGTTIAYSEITILDLIDTATYIYYSENESGTGATTAPTATTNYIGIYSGQPVEGGQPSTPPTGTIWSNYVGEEGNGIDPSNTYIEYNFNNDGINPPDENDTNWGTTVPDVPQGHYLWTRTVFTYTNGEKTYSYSSSYQGEDGQDAEAYDIETNQSEVFKFVSNYNEDGTNWIFSPNFLEIKVFKRPRDTESQPLSLTINNIDVKIIGYSESLMEYVTIGGLSTEEEGQSNVAIFNIQNAYVEGSSELVSLFNSTQGQFKIIYKDDEGKEVASHL